MTIRKIDLMHQMFGMTEHYCRDCLHFGRILVGDTKKVRKCEVYGVTASEASDWKASYKACGLFNMSYPYKDKQIIRYVKPERKRKIDDEPLEGQIDLDAWTLQGPGDGADMKGANMNNKLEFYWRMNDYGLRATPKRLVRFSDDEENETIDFVKYYIYEGKEFSYSIGFFRYNEKEPCWEFEFVGGRFTDISDEEIKPIWAMLKLAYKALEEWSATNSKNN